MSLEWAWLLGPVVSIGGLSVGLPLAAALLSSLVGRARMLPPAGSPLRLEILVPVYNETETIERTLQGVQAACRGLLSVMPGASLGITLALDGSSQPTRELVTQLASRAGDARVPIRVLDRAVNRGKWATIGELLAQSRGAWSALVDAGTLWPEDFLVRMSDRLTKGGCVGVAPGYRHSGGGWVSRLVWWQERALKTLENLAGGPVSLHGATMVFRTEQFREAFASLDSRSWLNDDVVLGLMLRCKGRVDYLGDELCVGDCGVKEGQGELGRRKRMLYGNIEWIRALFPAVARRAPVVGVIAARRIMRVLWAYHLIFSVFCLGMFVGLGFSGALEVVAGFIALVASNRRLREAGAVSLAAPILILRTKGAVRWS